MVKKQETKEQAVPKQEKRQIQDLSETELKALAFDIEQQIKQKQREYNFVFEELAKRNK